MNKRLERVETAQMGLAYIAEHLHDVEFNGPDMLLYLDDGKLFFVQGYKKKEEFNKKEANDGV